MAWLKIDDNAPGHKKILRVPPAARWLWVCGLAYCQRLRTDGAIPAEALDTFGVKSPTPLADALVTARLWHRSDDGEGYRVHDFLDWNDSARERDAKTNEKGERQRRWREGKRGATRLLVTTVDASTPSAADATPTPLPLPVQERTAPAALRPVEISKPKASTWKRAIAIAHAVMDECPDSADWTPEFKARCTTQGIDYGQRGGQTQRPLFARAIDYVEAQRARRPRVAS